MTEAADQARALRERIIDVCSRNGGHLGASLGVVELTLALQAEFPTPKNALVWDVGHQSYAHKILTGRAEVFGQLRKKGGPSGFPSREESPHDVFGAGHSSTSISAALGIATAKRLSGDETWTVAVIGDGGLTAGIAFEALNQAGASSLSRLVIVVNDNALSISRNVGALDRWAFGAERDPRRFFESLGFEYLGPVDGHDVGALRARFQQAKSANAARAVVIHVQTVKGKGYSPAEQEPVRFHGTGPFDKVTGKAEKKVAGASYSQVFGDALSKLAEANPRVIAITAAMADGTGLARFAGRFPERFFDVGIAEPHSIVFAAGVATQGFKPVAAIYSTFLQRAVDAVIHDAALQGLDLVIAVDRAGLVGADGATHQGAFDIALLRAVPGVSIAAPACAQDLELMLAEAIERPGVKAIRYPRGPAPRRSSFTPAPWGAARVVLAATKSPSVVIWALGNALSWAERAVEQLTAQERLDITLVDARFAKPIDSSTLRQTLLGAAALVTLEDGAVTGGFGSAVFQVALEEQIALPESIALLGIPDRWIHHAEIEEQRFECGLSDEQLATTLRRLLKR